MENQKKWAGWLIAGLVAAVGVVAIVMTTGTAEPPAATQPPVVTVSPSASASPEATQPTPSPAASGRTANASARKAHAAGEVGHADLVTPGINATELPEHVAVQAGDDLDVGQLALHALEVVRPGLAHGLDHLDPRVAQDAKINVVPLLVVATVDADLAGTCGHVILQNRVTTCY